MAAGPRSLDELRGEPLHPPVDGDVVNGDAALGQQFLDVPVGQAVAQVPADRERDHLRRVPKARRDGGRARWGHRISLRHTRLAYATVPVIVWHLLKEPTARYRELGSHHYAKHTDRNRKARSHIRQLQALGLDVTVTPKEEAA